MASVPGDSPLRALARSLPRGGAALDAETWAHRHRLLVRLLFAQALALAAYALATGIAPLHAAAYAAVPAFLGALASVRGSSRVFRSLAVAVGLLTESALLVHASDGLAEAHFHFFVMLAVLALYDDIVPYALGVAYVVVEHGVVGAFQPHAVFETGARADSPWLWAAVHGGFVFAAAYVHVVAWRANERVRARLRDAEERQRDERARGESYLELTGALVVALDRDGAVTLANRAACALLDYAPSEIAGRDWFDLAVPHGERAARRAVFERVLDGGGEATGEGVMLARDGRELRVAWRSIAVHGDHGEARGVLSSGVDVTAQRAAEAALEQERHDVAALARVSRRVASAPDARQAVVDAAREIAGASFTVLAEPDGHALALTCAAGAELAADRRVGGGSRPSGAAVAYLAGSPYLVHDVPRADTGVPGDARCASVLFQPAVLAGRVRGVLTVAWDEQVDGIGSRRAELTGMLADDAALAIERAERQRAMELAATTDPLTGVANRRAWDAGLALALREAAERGAPLCVAVVDLDRFKALNDERGHAAGDHVLQRCAAAWQDVLRPTDTLARIGGDEFGVLLPECDLEEARRVRERLAIVAPHDAGCSIGIARWDGRETAGELFRRADRDLYREKAERAPAPLSPPR